MKIIHVVVFPRRRASPTPCVRQPGAGSTNLSITHSFASVGAPTRSLSRIECGHYSEHAMWIFGVETAECDALSDAPERAAERDDGAHALKKTGLLSKVF